MVFLYFVVGELLLKGFDYVIIGLGDFLFLNFRFVDKLWIEFSYCYFLFCKFLWSVGGFFMGMLY